MRRGGSRPLACCRPAWGSRALGSGRSPTSCPPRTLPEIEPRVSPRAVTRINRDRSLRYQQILAFPKMTRISTSRWVQARGGCCLMGCPWRVFRVLEWLGRVGQSLVGAVGHRPPSPAREHPCRCPGPHHQPDRPGSAGRPRQCYVPGGPVSASPSRRIGPDILNRRNPALNNQPPPF